MANVSVIGNGLAVRPLHTRGTSKKKNKRVSDYLTRSTFLKLLVEYSDIEKMDIVYLTGMGIMYQDDILDGSVTLRDIIQNTSWCNIVAEELYRLCLSLGTNKIVLLARSDRFLKLAKTLRSRGVIVENPIMGVLSERYAIKILFSKTKLWINTRGDFSK